MTPYHHSLAIIISPQEGNSSDISAHTGMLPAIASWFVSSHTNEPLVNNNIGSIDEQSESEAIMKEAFGFHTGYPIPPVLLLSCLPTIHAN